MYVLDIPENAKVPGAVHHVTWSVSPDSPATIYVNGQRMNRIDEG